MSDQNWREFAPLAGVTLVAASLLAAMMVLPQYLSENYEQRYATDYERAETEPASPPFVEQICADAEVAEHDKPDESDKWSICAQYRTAVATERAAHWSYVQAWLSGIGLFGLALTVSLAALAWREAKRSADAASKSLKAAKRQLREQRKSDKRARRISRRQSAAYVHALGAVYTPPPKNGLIALPGDPDGTVVITLENFGETAALNVLLEYEIRVEPIPGILAAKELTADHRIRRSSNIAPGGKSPVELLFEEGVFSRDMEASNGTRVTLRGAIRYSDVFDKRYRTAFAMHIYRSSILLGKPTDFTLMTFRMDAFKKIDLEGWELQG